MSEITIITSCVCVGSSFYFVKRQHNHGNSDKKKFNRVGSITVSEVEYVIILVGSWCQAVRLGAEVAECTIS